MKLFLTVVLGLATVIDASCCTGQSLAQELVPCCDEVPLQPIRRGSRYRSRQSEYVTLPGDFPAITVTVPASNTAPGYLFVTSFTGPGLPTAAPYLMILDNQGEPVYYKKQPPNQAATDLKRHANGQLTYYDRSVGKFRALDQTYATVRLLLCRQPLDQPSRFSTPAQRPPAVLDLQSAERST